VKLLLSLMILTSGVRPFALFAQVRSETARDYGWGRMVGDCLVSKCQIFRGFLLTESLKSGEFASVRVAEQLVGPPIGTETVEVPYGDPNDVRMSGVSPNRAWRGGVTFSRNAPVMVALALEDNPYAKAGQPMLVTSDEHCSAIIRTLVADAAHLETVPDGISSTVASLARDPNPALAGYLYAHLTRREIVDKPELECALLLQMVGSPSVPPEAWTEIALEARTQYHRLSTTGKTTLGRRFLQLCQDPDKRIAAASFKALAGMGSFDDPAWQSIEPSSIQKFTTVYRALVMKGAIPRNQPLEAGLGIKYE
jgi:hypothetical protein